MLYRHLLLLGIFSSALSLSGCGGLDDSVSPFQKPNSGTTGSGNNGSGNSGNGGSGDSGNGGSGGNNHVGAPNCPTPASILPHNRLGNTNDSTNYTPLNYSATAENGSLVGTWVFLVHTDYSAPEASGTTWQKFVTVIEADGSNYQIGNCAGVTPITLIKKCTNAAGNQEVDCGTAGSKVFSTVRQYQAWQPKLSLSLGEDLRIKIPLLGFGFSEGVNRAQQEATLLVDNMSNMHSEDGRITGIKISTSTANLGTAQFITGSHAGGVSPVWCVMQAQDSQQQCTVTSVAGEDASTIYSVTPKNTSNLLQISVSAEDGVQQILTAADSSHPSGVDKFVMRKYLVEAGDDTQSGKGFFALNQELDAPTSNSQTTDLHQLKIQLVKDANSIQINTEKFNTVRP